MTSTTTCRTDPPAALHGPGPETHPSHRPPQPHSHQHPHPGEQAAPVMKFHAPELVFGAGSLAEAGFAALRLGARRPFVVTDPGLLAAGWPGELLAHLRAVGLSPTVWSAVTPNPKDHEIAAGYESYLEHGCDVLVAIGGGSCIDAAKGIAIVASNGGTILDYTGVDLVTRPIPPLLMIPTTAGTGADVSQFCIITDTANTVKVTIMGRALVPDISITDPRLLTTMPDDLAAATGLDALTHGIEAYVSRAHNLLTDGHALNAVGLVFGHLPQMIDRRDAVAHRDGMAQASLEAGMAFSNAILGATHAMSHQVGGLLDLPHGVVNGVLLPHVIRYNAVVSPERFVRLAEVAGAAPAGVGADEAGDALAAHVREVADLVGVPRGLSELGVTEADVATLARNAMADACLTTNPRPAGEADLAALFRAAL